MFYKNFVEKVTNYRLAIEIMCGDIMDDIKIFPNGYYSEVGPIIMGLGLFIIDAFFNENNPKILNMVARTYRASLKRCYNSKHIVELHLQIMNNAYSNYMNLTISDVFEADDNGEYNVVKKPVAECFAKQLNIENTEEVIESIKTHIQNFIEQCKIISLIQ